MCIAACLLAFSVLSLSLNSGVGSAAPTTGNTAGQNRFAPTINAWVTTWISPEG